MSTKQDTEFAKVGHCEHAVELHVGIAIIVQHILYLPNRISLSLAGYVCGLIKESGIITACESVVGCRLGQWIKLCVDLPTTGFGINSGIGKHHSAIVQIGYAVYAVGVSSQEGTHIHIVELVELEVGQEINCANVIQCVVEILGSLQRHIECHGALIFTVVDYTQYISAGNVRSCRHSARHTRCGLYPKSKAGLIDLECIVAATHQSDHRIATGFIAEFVASSGTCDLPSIC